MKNKVSIEEYKKMLVSNGSSTDKPRKYRNNVIHVDGERFDSNKEFSRYSELLILERAKYISKIERQKKFLLLPKTKQERAVTYTGDFYYYDERLKKHVSEDVKSEITKKIPAYVIKRKLFKWRYPDIKFLEV